MLFRSSSSQSFVHCVRGFRTAHLLIAHPPASLSRPAAMMARCVLASKAGPQLRGGAVAESASDDGTTQYPFHMEKRRPAQVERRLADVVEVAMT